MGRLKGQKLSDEQKAALKAKRIAGKINKQSSFYLVSSNLKHLSFEELTRLSSMVQNERKNKLGNEELRLIKEKEQIEQKLQQLKQLDASMNG